MLLSVLKRNRVILLILLQVTKFSLCFGRQSRARNSQRRHRRRFHNGGRVQDGGGQRQGQNNGKQGRIWYECGDGIFELDDLASMSEYMYAVPQRLVRIRPLIDGDVQDTRKSICFATTSESNEAASLIDGHVHQMEVLSEDYESIHCRDHLCLALFNNRSDRNVCY